MQNLNEEQASLVEIVPTESNREENFYFILVIISVLAVAASLLVLTRQDKDIETRLPNELVNLVTQLQNAQDEIALLQSISLLPKHVDLISLESHELAPFSTQAFTQLSDQCFVTKKNNFEVAFIKQSSDWSIHWNRIDHIEHNHLEKDCSQIKKWTAVHLIQK